MRIEHPERPALREAIDAFIEDPCVKTFGRLMDLKLNITNHYSCLLDDVGWQTHGYCHGCPLSLGEKENYTWLHRGMCSIIRADVEGVPYQREHLANLLVGLIRFRAMIELKEEENEG